VTLGTWGQEVGGTPLRPLHVGGRGDGRGGSLSKRLNRQLMQSRPTRPSLAHWYGGQARLQGTPEGVIRDATAELAKVALDKPATR
jgi:hypothetical protein